MNNKASSSKIYWIIGGIATLVLIGGFIVVAAAGAGLYFYTAEKDTEIVAKEKSDKTPAEKTKNDDDIAIELPLPKDKQSEDFVDFVKKEYSRLGTFKLIEAKPVKTRYFSQADFVVGAEYSETNSDSILVHTFSHYKDWDTARAEAVKIMDEFKAGDPKLKPEITKTKVLGIVISNDHLARFDCRERKGAGTCDFIASKDPKQLLRYIKLFFK